ncbi:major outer membrane protein [Aliarcobacter butzleri]|uniref:major outer membrane protein n=1 Tax=Aliarcobacter butzleri TaxID=28197 RepID=UPI00102DF01D|nr:major outer membrane protein [Aliarcobacter butzleri]RZV16981.1 major outer membrane protein [Aliarcobacter butzleri]
MRKISKLSLVAAVAVAGFSTANAQPLEEAIKNVEVSGSVVYRYNDRHDDRGVSTSSSDNNYKIGLNLSSKVNDYVKFNSRFLVANPGLFNDNGFASLPTQDAGDASPEAKLSHANFAFTGIKNTTITAGKQGLTTPWTVAIDSDGGEQSGTGILAITTVGPVSFAGAYFNQTNLDTSGDAIATLNAIQTINKNLGATDIATAGIIGNLEVVTLDAWYLNMKDVFDTYTVGAKSDFKFDGGKIGFDARYVYLDPAESLIKEQELAKIAVSGNVGIVNAKVAYAWTGKDGGTTAIDNDAETTLLGWNINANNKTDADYWQLVLGVNVLDNLNLSANYGNAQWNPNATTEREQEEIYAQVTYKMSKNLSTYVRYGTFTDEETVSGTKTKLFDGENVGRLQVEYTF